MAIGGLNAMLKMGTMQSYMKNSELAMKFEQRKQDIAQRKGKEMPEPTQKEREIARIQEQMAEMRESQPIQQIDLKLKSGGELTDEELEYLREKDPEMYKKAVEIKQERAAYKKQLQNCRTKEDVERVRSSKLQRFAAEIKDIRGNPNIGEGKKLELIEQVGRRFMGVLAEHSKFTDSKAYKELPTEEELRTGKKKKPTDKDELTTEDTDKLAAEIKQALAVLELPTAQGGEVKGETETVEPTKLSVKA